MGASPQQLDGKAATAVQKISIRTAVGSFDALAAGPHDGPPVLLLHGFPQSALQWQAQLKALAAVGFRAVAIDQRGYCPGVRPTDDSGYVLSELTADVLRCADALGWDAFHLVGHDWGAAIAWVVADQCPERISTVTAVSVPHPAAFAAAMATDDAQQQLAGRMDMLRSPDAAQVMLADDAKALKAMFARGVPTRHSDEYIARLSQGAMDPALAWYRNTRPDAVQCGDIKVPTLYVWGATDFGISRAAAEGTAAHVLGPYTPQFLDGVGHWVPEEAPTALTDALIGHLHSNTPRPTEVAV